MLIKTNLLGFLNSFPLYLCQQKETVQFKYKDSYLYTFLSRKVEGIGPMKPWQPTQFGKGATSFSKQLEIDKLQTRASYNFYIKLSSSTCLEESFFCGAHIKTNSLLGIFSVSNKNMFKINGILITKLRKVQ